MKKFLNKLIKKYVLDNEALSKDIVTEIHCKALAKRTQDMNRLNTAKRSMSFNK